MDKPNRDNIILIGFMGVGKTTVGKLLSQRIGYEFIDTDDLIVSTAGIPITDIFSRYGDSYFRILEKRAIAHALKRPGIVLATGGGAVTDPDNFFFLKERGCVIALDAEEDILWDRLKAATDRPMLFSGKPRERMKALLKARRPIYHKAHFIVSVDDKTPEEVADEIISIIRSDECISGKEKRCGK